MTTTRRRVERLSGCAHSIEDWPQELVVSVAGLAKELAAKWQKHSKANGKGDSALAAQLRASLNALQAPTAASPKCSVAAGRRSAQIAVFRLALCPRPYILKGRPDSTVTRACSGHRAPGGPPMVLRESEHRDARERRAACGADSCRPYASPFLV
jgi:hypothetical protein